MDWSKAYLPIIEFVDLISQVNYICNHTIIWIINCFIDDVETPELRNYPLLYIYTVIFR